MSSHYRFDLASPADDGALRSVLRQTSMPGEISLSLRREPNFFIAERSGNESSQVLVCRDDSDNGIVGFGCRAIRTAFVDGTPRSIGYLSLLRALSSVRGRSLLARGYRFLRELDRDHQVPFYLTTILEDNETAQAILTSGRAGLPTYRRVGVLKTLLIPLSRRGVSRPSGRIRAATPADSTAIVMAVNQYNRCHQFSPVWSEGDITGRTSLLPHFDPSNILLYESGGHLTGTLGIWDQEAFKQTVVSGYSRGLRVARPILNGLSRVAGTPKLPPAGGSVVNAYGVLVSARDNDPRILRALLKEAIRRLGGRGYAYLLLGLHEGHALLPEVASCATRTLSSSTYLVYWSDRCESQILPSEHRLPLLEIATL